jgi:hypothetical protein
MRVEEDGVSESGYDYGGMSGPTDVPAKWTCPRCGFESWADENVNQDLHDGDALRRLREALPERYQMRCHPGIYEPLWFVDVWVGPAMRPELSHHWIGLSGATIAEAADRCREAMSER